MSQQLSRREVVKKAITFQNPPYVPWSFFFTKEALEKLENHYGTKNLDPYVHNHILGLGNGIGFFDCIGEDLYKDVFGVVWDRSVEKDIGHVVGQVLPEPTLEGYHFPNPHDPRFFSDIPEKLALHPDCYRMFQIGFSLFERAWTLRGLEDLYMDFIENPEFVHQLLDAIADYNIAQATKAMEYDIDAVHFGDDWGQQHGLLIGYDLWKEFIYPRLQRMYAAVKKGGKIVSIHSCGDVDELFDDLTSIGVGIFNPFQPEVMDVAKLIPQYQGKLSFFGGVSTQRTMPYGTPDDVRHEVRRMKKLGQTGGYILSPAHAVEGDVPLENMLAFIEEAHVDSPFLK